MKIVFADAFYFVAFVNRADQHHQIVLAAAKEIRADILTTEWILAEFADALAASKSRHLVPAFIRDLKTDPRIEIVPASSELFARGILLYEQRPDKKWSLTDCISFVVMRDRKVQEALTGDEHFRQAGFVPLLRS